MEIENYDNYLIYPDGKIWSKFSKKFLKLQNDKDGYKIINLSKNGKLKTHKIHRLVALHYIPNPNNLPQVNHKNCKKDDNNIENLEWCDHSYNNQSFNKEVNVGTINKTKYNTYEYRLIVNGKYFFKNFKTLEEAESQRILMKSMLSNKFTT